MNNYQAPQNFGQAQGANHHANGQANGSSLNKLPVYNSSQNYSMQQ